MPKKKKLSCQHIGRIQIYWWNSSHVHITCTLHLQNITILTSHITRAQSHLWLLLYWTEQLSRSKTAEIISFLGFLYDGQTGKIDQPTPSGQVASWKTWQYLKRGNQPHFKIGSGYLQILSWCFVPSIDDAVYFFLNVQVLVVYIFILSKSPGDLGHGTNLFSGENAGNGQTCPTDTSHSPAPRGLRETGKRNEMRRQMIGAQYAPAMGETVWKMTSPYQYHLPHRLTVMIKSNNRERAL